VSTRPTAKAPAQPWLSAAARGTYVAFIGCGFAFASWASRIPQVRDRLELTSAELELVLLTIAAGSVTALLLAGVIVSRFHSRSTVTAMAALQGAAVERRLGRAIMPRFHAGYSIGTVAGALVGAIMVAFHVPVTPHLLAVAVVEAVVVPAAVRSFIPDVDDPDAEPGPADATGTTASALRRWREPRTLLVGIVVLAFAFAEGAGIDWISLSLIDGYRQSAVVGTLGFAAFLAAMTIGRWFADGLLARYGRVRVIRGQTVLAIAGVLLLVFSPATPLALAGVLLWGVGASLGFPVGMSAAADNPAAAAGRVSVVASIGYCAFLGGPPLIGYLGQSVTVLRALIAVAVVLALATLVTGALRPLPAHSRREMEDAHE
jgi:fucose permease